MKQVLIRRGGVVVDEVPAPLVEPGTVLVRVDHSCISVGTELSGIHASGMPLWERAVRQPARVRRLATTAATQGIANTRRLVEGRLNAGQATGYSAAGVVVEVGDGIDDVRRGDRVACAGAQSAHHAEVIRVPRNLVVPVPASVSLADASTVTLGAIALQGVRRAQPTLGECFVVIGLGAIGQLTIQLLKANGCQVIGADPEQERTQLALDLGMDAASRPELDDGIEQVRRLTNGIGADGVIVTAATASDAVMSTAFGMCRRKGRVVLVGDVGLDLNRQDLYEKELDFFISSSYGPGRYDRNYEERGLDYPVGYVRWTENRNMAEYLRLVADGKVRVEPLVGGTYPIAEAVAAYAGLERGEHRPVMVLLNYPTGPEGAPTARTVPTPSARPVRPGRIRVAVVGAGTFAKGTHLPNLGVLSHAYELRAVVSRSGPNATSTAAQYGAAYSATDYLSALEDPDVDLVVVATRHNLHARIALEALQHGKHVLVEKPLALTSEELDGIVGFYERWAAPESPPVLLTGFNRRFSRYARRIAELTASRTGPMLLTYRMNAGYAPLDQWVHGTEGGGRNLGEACHVYDLFTYLTGSRVVDVQADTVRPRTAYYSPTDNFIATVRFDDGSLATLAYTALGAAAHPKEQLEVFVDGAVIVLDDYRRLHAVGARTEPLSTPVPQKGQREELEALAHALQSGGDWPIPLWQQVQATRIALAVEPYLHGQG